MPRRSRSRSISMTDSAWDQITEEADRLGQTVTAFITGLIATYFRTKVTKKSAWETDEEDWYDPNRFYTFSQDKYGHSAKIDVTIPKHIAGQIRGIVDSGAISELRTVQDFLRNAVRHESYRIGKMIDDKGLVEAAHVMTLADSIAHEQSEAAETQKLISNMSSFLEEEILLGHLSYAEQKIKEFWAGASVISGRFRDAYMTTLRDYGKILKEAQAEDGSRKKGTVTRDDGTRFKNGVEITPRKPRRKPST